MRHHFLPLLALGPLAACGADEPPATAPDAAPESTASESASPGTPPPEQRPIDPDSTGTLVGAVLFEGEPPPLRTLDDVPEQPGCHEGHDGPPLSEFTVVVDGRVRNVFVSVGGGLESWIVPETSPEPAELVQHGCIYRPHALALRTGQLLRVVNDDPTNHNVNARARKNESFNVNQGPGASPIEVTYEHDEVVPYRCDIHPWMSAYVAVFEHPFFDVTDERGEFRIEGLPPGEYVIEALHPDNKKLGKNGRLRGTAVIRTGEETRLELGY